MSTASLPPPTPLVRSASIPLPSLRACIRISRGNVIARVLLERIGLCLGALRIELLAKLALGSTTLRCLGAFLEERALSALHLYL